MPNVGVSCSAYSQVYFTYKKAIMHKMTKRYYLFIAFLLFFLSFFSLSIFTMDSYKLKVILTIVFSLILLLIMFFVFGTKDQLMIIPFFYFYFSFGPAINYVFNFPIYKGIVIERIFESTIIFTTALISMLFSGYFFKKNPICSVQKETKINFIIFDFIFILSIIFTLYFLFDNRNQFFVAKNNKIADFGNTLHYSYLFLQICILSLYFLIKNKKRSLRFYFVNLLLYIFYCLLFGERDFVFVIAVLVWFSYLKGEKTASSKNKIFLFIKILLLIFLATMMFNFRLEDSSGISLEGILNQGSILFINTQIIEYTDNYKILMLGKTYLNSIMNILPSQVYSTHFSLPIWFKDFYAPGGVSGYGFALDAESYLNFRYFGVALFFCVIVAFYRYLSNRLQKSYFYNYYNVFFTIFFLYSLRNDSLALIKGSIYGLIFYYGLYINNLVFMKLKIGK